MRLIKGMVLIFTITLVIGIGKRLNETYDCYKLVSENAERSKELVKYVAECMGDVIDNNHLPCYYRGCQ